MRFVSISILVFCSVFHIKLIQMRDERRNSRESGNLKNEKISELGRNEFHDKMMYHLSPRPFDIHVMQFVTLFTRSQVGRAIKNANEIQSESAFKP